jgi:hypothetical protein
MQENQVSRERIQASESSFMSSVYLWMSLGLFLSAFASMWVMTQPALLKLIFSNSLVLFGIIAVELIMVIWLSAQALKMSDALATALFCGYALLNGVTLASIFFIYTMGSIATTFAITAGTFLFFSVYGFTTKKDLTSIGSLCMMGLFGVIIASVVNIFLKSDMLMWVSTFIGIAVFLGLIAYDTQKLKALHAMGFDNPEIQKKGAILGALTLYLDFINLFILLLRIFGRRRD